MNGHVIKNFSLSFFTRERELIKENCKASELRCNISDCPFYLVFKTKGDNKEYVLTEYNDKHSHKLQINHTSKAVTPAIYGRLNELQNSAKGLPNLRLSFLYNAFDQLVDHLLV